MKKKIVIAILCAAVSMGTIGCGNSTASAKTTQMQTDKKEDSKSENSEKSSDPFPSYGNQNLFLPAFAETGHP